ncbi:metallophosphoesterase [Cardiobacteriaceae bacterium TAE3-ERU3]|nr:metallophosphoesterase [Cardiobacteriaceae bacterium TAE3-ERU3]
MIYDIIGDIHGQADKLKGLLQQLGYRHNGQYFVPPANHQALFIGDFIDRGGKELETLQIVFAMLDAGVAQAVMGNHEYNALAYATLDKVANDGSYLREHKESNHKQHKAFLREAPFGSELHQFWLQRFYELPLWIETEEACFVHACWDSDSMAVLKPLLTKKHCLTPQALQATGQKRTPAFDALENVLKGIEMQLPDGIRFKDKNGISRSRMRMKWWMDRHDKTLREVSMAAPSDLAQVPEDVPVPVVDFELKTDKPVFIGHYWAHGEPAILSEQVVCVDYSAALEGGYLTCYQFDTENPLPLSNGCFVQYRHD